MWTLSIVCTIFGANALASVISEANSDTLVACCTIAIGGTGLALLFGARLVAGQAGCVTLLACCTIGITQTTNTSTIFVTSRCWGLAIGVFVALCALVGCGIADFAISAVVVCTAAFHTAI